MYVGDGSCDDGVNIPECNYDNGDCCLPNPLTMYCTLCLCKSYDYHGEICRNDITQIGDGLCDDATNVQECDFDGGDCCGNDVSTELCEICTCHLGHTSVTLPPTTTKWEYLSSKL